MRFINLASGSRGNCQYIEMDGEALLVDCGLGRAALRQRFASQALDIRRLHGVFVTHAHSDHVCGAFRIAHDLDLPVHLTEGTLLTARGRNIPHVDNVEARLVRPGEPARIAGFTVLPVPISHDCREPVACRVERGDRSALVLTDLGCEEGLPDEPLRDLDYLLLEANHDEDLLRDGPYPDYLKARIGGAKGHLSNRQSARLLGRILDGSPGLRAVLLGHLSEANNRPELAMAALGDAVSPDRQVDLRVASQNRPVAAGMPVSS